VDGEAAVAEPGVLIDRAAIAGMRGSEVHDPVEERAAFIEAMSRTANGVTVLATAGEMGRFGQTVSSMCSVSADPPLLLACINRKSPTCQAITGHRVFSVNVLRADQQRVSQVFAGRPRTGAAYDFGCAVWEEAVTGSPLLVGAVARFDCELEAMHEAGTHRIFIGRVVASKSAPGTPLLYAQRGYGELQLFPRHRPEWRVVPAGFVGDEPDDASDDLWETEVWG
jgi:flavin reductase (DIM6/NTAB) family NADH-FMN oxidoreductase RutF